MSKEFERLVIGIFLEFILNNIEKDTLAGVSFTFLVIYITYTTISRLYNKNAKE